MKNKTKKNIIFIDLLFDDESLMILQITLKIYHISLYQTFVSTPALLLKYTLRLLIRAGILNLV